MGVLTGKIALITGSTGGIGKAIAEGYAAAGATVWIHGRRQEEGAALAQRLGGHFIKADLSRPDDVDALADALLAQETRLDVLVNNAGVEIIMPLEALNLAHLDLIWQVNVRAPFHLTHRLLPLLRQSSGASIINITSIHDTMPYPHNAAYSASKAALAMFTKTIAVELAPHGIRVNNFAPGAVETEINRDVIHEIGAEKFREWIPLGRVAQSEEMIGPAVFLASEAASYVTGTTLYADGAYLQNLVRYRP
ncbi:MAG: SDR family oxidoreductase [Anaerolineae bacterium]|nr:SDR family oxidoreductase [Anaerolineae bacterium]